MARSKGVPLPVTPKVHAPSRGASCILSNPKDGTSEFDGLCFGLIIEDIGCTHDSAHERIDSTCGIAFFCADTVFVFIHHTLRQFLHLAFLQLHAWQPFTVHRRSFELY